MPIFNGFEFIGGLKPHQPILAHFSKLTALRFSTAPTLLFSVFHSRK
jgi:hypothetical protein